jgi:hypothetical protein
MHIIAHKYAFVKRFYEYFFILIILHKKRAGEESILSQNACSFREKEDFPWGSLRKTRLTRKGKYATIYWVCPCEKQDGRI